MTDFDRGTDPAGADFTAAVGAVLDYWFGERMDDPHALQRQSRYWFADAKARDGEIAARFGRWIEPVADRAPESFESAAELLAAVLVLDQFPRQVFRGTARAFAYDGCALACLDVALERQWDSPLHPVQAGFLYMPCQHAENLARQKLGVRLYEQLLGRTPEPFRALVENNLDYARQHRELIARFGRFPHRNAVLGRASTAGEEAYLADGGSRFGQ